MDKDALLETPIQLTDLEEILSTINQVEAYHMAIDLADRYKKLDNRRVYSPLTKQLRMTKHLVETYIDAIKTDEEPDESS